MARPATLCIVVAVLLSIAAIVHGQTCTQGAVSGLYPFTASNLLLYGGSKLTSPTTLTLTDSTLTSTGVSGMY